MHENPLRAGLVAKSTDWKWSSARWYKLRRSVGVPLQSIEDSTSSGYATPVARVQTTGAIYESGVVLDGMSGPGSSEYQFNELSESISPDYATSFDLRGRNMQTRTSKNHVRDYYVYVYIDPRNHEEFYYGKGRGSRKVAHLKDNSGSEKSIRIGEIRRAGLEPIIRVIARDLTQSEALLVEKTLLWKLGKWTLNIATGHFAKKFRPRDTLHKELFGFDFKSGLYYYNVGENEARNWDDYAKLGFISAGWGSQVSRRNARL